MTKDTMNGHSNHNKKKSTDRRISGGARSAATTATLNGHKSNETSERLGAPLSNGTTSGSDNNYYHKSSPNDGNNEEKISDLHTMDFTVGKKGGTFMFPFGGQLSVQPETIAKRGVITCTQVPAEERYRYEPKLKNNTTKYSSPSHLMLVEGYQMQTGGSTRSGLRNKPKGSKLNTCTRPSDEPRSSIHWKESSAMDYRITEHSTDERLVSEIYVIDTHGRSLRRPIGVLLNRHRVNCDVTEVGVLWKPSNSSFWQSAEASPGPEAVINFVATAGGAFAVVSYPKCERFDLPALGCLYSARLHRQVTVRCPKGAAGTDLQCDVQIIPLQSESLKSPLAQADIAASTDYFRFTTSPEDFEFKRPLTVKLPLPVSSPSDVKVEDVAVCRSQSSKNGVNSWMVIDGALKLSKNSVTFDTKILSKFIVLIVKPAGTTARTMLPCAARLPETLSRVEADTDRPRADILPFIELAPKRWTLWIDCVRKDMVSQAIEARSDMTLIKPSSLLPMAVYGRPTNQRTSRTSTNAMPVNKDSVVNGNDSSEVEVRAASGGVFFVEVTGDIEISDEDDGRDNAKVTYHDGLRQSTRRFTLIPKTSSIEDGPKVLTGIIRVHQQNALSDSANTEDAGQSQPVRCFDFDVPLDVVAEYLYVEPEPEVLTPMPTGRDKLTSLMTSLQTQPVVTVNQPTVVRRDPKEVAETINRLTKATRLPAIVPKEPRVLTGRSLQCIAREVPAGINLAVRLEISESTITGMAFDALASGLQSVDITYRILLLWKRRASAAGLGIGYRAAPDAVSTAMVMALAAAIEAVGNANVARVILEQHRINKEITPECFQQTTADDLDLQVDGVA